MMKPVATIAGVALVGVVAAKLLGLLLFPLLGMFLGFVVWALKITLIVALIWWGFHLFRRWTDRTNET